MEFLEIPISRYRSCRDNKGEVATLADFLRECIASKDTVNLYRNAPDNEKKRIKTTLPAYTISGNFTPTRTTANLKHSGLICIDIDKVQPEAVMNELKQIDNILFCSRSISGNGVFAIIPLAYPDQHKSQFKALERCFADMGITIDAQCCDTTRLRIISHDPEAFLNPDAVPYTGLHEEVNNMPQSYFPNQHSENTDAKNELNKFEDAVKRCVDKVSQDLTSTYQDWVRIGMSLASMGESGRKYYHALSRFNPGYTVKETDNKFSALLNREPKRMGIGTFFEIMNKYGYRYK